MNKNKKEFDFETLSKVFKEMENMEKPNFEEDVKNGMTSGYTIEDIEYMEDIINTMSKQLDRQEEKLKLMANYFKEIKSLKFRKAMKLAKKGLEVYYDSDF